MWTIGVILLSGAGSKDNNFLSACAKAINPPAIAIAIAATMNLTEPQIQFQNR